VKPIVLHILPSDIQIQTRLFKEAAFTLREEICGKVAVLGLRVSKGQTDDVADDRLSIFRARTLFYSWREHWAVRNIWILRAFLICIGAVEYSVAAVRVAMRIGATHISCHYLTALPQSWLAARLCGAKLIYLPHELEIHRWGVSKIARPAHELVERLFIRAASSVVVVCEPIAEWYRKTYNLTNVSVVRNVPEESALEIHDLEGGRFRERFAIPDTALVFIYQGVFSAVRGVDRLIEIFSSLKKCDCHLVLMGFGDESDIELVRMASITHSNIHFQPGVPREEILSYTSGADVGIYIAGDPPINDKLCLPNKFFEFTHSGLAVLVSDNLEYLSDIVRSEDIGWAVPYDNVAETIENIAQSDLPDRKRRAVRFARGAVWENDAEVFRHVYGE